MKLKKVKDLSSFDDGPLLTCRSIQAELTVALVSGKKPAHSTPHYSSRDFVHKIVRLKRRWCHLSITTLQFQKCHDWSFIYFMYHRLRSEVAYLFHFLMGFVRSATFSAIIKQSVEFSRMNFPDTCVHPMYVVFRYKKSFCTVALKPFSSRLESIAHTSNISNCFELKKKFRLNLISTN